MRIEYESTLEFAVEANLAVHRRLGTIRRSMVTAMLVVVAGFLPALAILLLLLGVERLGLALTGTVLVLWGLIALTAEWRIRRAVRTAVLRMRGGDAPIRCELTLDDWGVDWRTQEQRIGFAWRRVAAITEGPGWVDFEIKDPTLVRVPSSAFASAEQRAAFVGYAKERMGRSGA